jgi:hypothetical protein
LEGNPVTAMKSPHIAILFSAKMNKKVVGKLIKIGPDRIKARNRPVSEKIEAVEQFVTKSN